MFTAEPLEKYEEKVTCYGGALAFSEPEKSQAQIKEIIESAYDHGVDLIEPGWAELAKPNISRSPDSLLLHPPAYPIQRYG